MITKIARRISTIILELENLILIYVGFVPCHFFRRFFYKTAGIKIGKGSTIHTGARFYKPNGIKIGKDSIIGEGAVLDGRAPLIIGDHVDFASEVMVYNAQHDLNDPSFKAVKGSVEIGDYVFIGPRAIILPGVKIGKGAVVAAGAVVNRDVEDFMIVGGVPAKPIRERELKNPSYKLGRAAWFR
ncbi:acyltransferase [Patescibacteria group bacterium]|nr:acyltransferase [Patescibacteria group bacterium]